MQMTINQTMKVRDVLSKSKTRARTPATGKGAKSNPKVSRIRDKSLQARRLSLLVWTSFLTP